MNLSHSYSSLKMFENCPLSYQRQRILKDVKYVQGAEAEVGERIHKQLEDRIKMETALPAESAALEPAVQAILKAREKGGEVSTEREMVLNPSLEVTTWWAKDAWIRSKIDVLVRFDDSAIVIDWKTGKRRPDFAQLELFALQVFAHHPLIDRVTSAFVWTKEVKQDKEVYTREQAPVLWENFLSRVRRVEQAAEKNIWPARPSGLCNWCPCKPTCGYAK